MAEVDSKVEERPLSPVLNSCKRNRRIAFGVRKRHPTQEIPKLKVLLCEILKATNPTQRIRKIQQYEDEKRRLRDYFYKINQDFDFKKPICVKEFRRPSTEKALLFSQESQVANFCEATPIEGETPEDSLESEIIDAGNKTDPSLNTTEPEKAFLGFEEFELKVANELYNRIAAAHQEHCRIFGSKNVFDVVSSVDNADAMDERVEDCQDDSAKMEIDVNAVYLKQNGLSVPGSFDLGSVPNDFANGFSTAAGKSIKVSTKALVKANEKFLEQFKQVLTPDSDCDINVKKSLDDGGTNGIKVPSKDLCGGFATAGGRPITVSERALRKANTLHFGDLGNVTGFTTAAGTDIKEFKDNLLIAKTSLSDDLNTAGLFFSENLDDLPSVRCKSGNLTGFTTAAGNDIRISEEKLRQAKGFLNDFNVPAKNSIKTNNALLKSHEKISEDYNDIGVKHFDFDSDCSSTAHVKQFLSTGTGGSSFSTASGKDILVSSDAFNKVSHLFADDFCVGSSIVNRQPNTPSQRSLRKSHTSNIADIQGNVTGFTAAAGTKEKCLIAKRSFSDDLNTAGNTGRLSTNMSQANKFFSENFDDLPSIPSNSGLGNGFVSATKMFAEDLTNNHSSTTKTDSTVKSDHYLSVQSIVTGFDVRGLKETLVNKTETLIKLEEDKENHKDTESNLELNCNIKIASTSNIQDHLNATSGTPQRNRKRLGISGCKQILIPSEKLHTAQSIFNETESIISPYKRNETVYNSTPVKKEFHSRLGLEFDNMSPVAKKPRLCTNTSLHAIPAPCVLQQQSGAIPKRLEDFNLYLKNLEDKLRIAQERQATLLEQAKLIEVASEMHKRQSPGILFQKKKSVRARSSLNEFVLTYDTQTPHLLTKITPQNVLHVHFNDNRFADVAFLKTEDQACIVPNAAHLIGLAEITSAFSAMPGVDPKLIPKKWIDNHFKWIVWKLVSYERNFAELSGCLTAENVIQQLKYRYDREIDMAERPALRRIIEKDDVPQKRLVLCVSNICRVGDMYELELTDGWYSIRTTIDAPLCFQIKRGKIVIGTKLITQYAELVNCDGCHPLEVPDHTRLKISYNCTRRAAWFVKLGYQKNSKPFPISFNTVNPAGGLIGCMKVYIARIYPLRFMEKLPDGAVIWRNQKAEEKYMQVWENQQMKEAEIICNRIGSDYESIARDDSQTILNTQAMNTHVEQQNELSLRLMSELNQLKKSGRDVTSVMKIRIVDCTSNCSSHNFIFNIWKATDDHLNTLKEGSIVSIYNVTPRRNGELTATSRTSFKYHSKLPNMKLQRQLLPISMLQQSFLNPLFNEFDSIGTVVRINKDTNHQEIWLCDFTGRLLLIQVRESDSTCLLLDSTAKGQHVAVSNVIFCKPHDTFAQATATQCSIITNYPSQLFLQEALVKYSEQLPKNLDSLLAECSSIIDAFESSHFPKLLNDTLEDSTEIPSRLTSLDVAMSLIDTNQYN